MARSFGAFLGSHVSSIRRFAGPFKAAASLAFLSAAFASAQTTVKDASALKPPAGARVAIVEFADLQCPACAAANPTLKGAAAKYNIPWVRHDFLIPMHNWSRNAAIYARWFDAQGKSLGDEYRDQIFANQNAIFNPATLLQFTSGFARTHNIPAPMSFDPDAKFAAAVQADNELGRNTGITLTPTVFVVSGSGPDAHFVQVQKIDQDLYATIDQALKDTRPAAPAPAKRPVTKKPAGK